MASWRCKKCGYTKESRCRPRKCPHCSCEEFAKSE